MMSNPVEFSDAVLDQAVNLPVEGGPSSTRVHMHATFTSAVAAALGIQHLKDCADDAKAIPLKVACKSFRARLNVPGLPYDLSMHGDEVKQFRLVFPEKEQPRIHWCLYGTAKGKDWADYADTVGLHPATLVLTPLQGELPEEADDDEDKVYPQQQLDGSYPFELAKVRELSNANATTSLYALEMARGVWLYGWNYAYGNVGGTLTIEHREITCSAENEAIRAAALDLAGFFESVLATKPGKKERETIDSICEWLQPFIDWTPAPEPDAENAAEVALAALTDEDPED